MKEMASIFLPNVKLNLLVEQLGSVPHSVHHLLGVVCAPAIALALLTETVSCTVDPAML